MLRFHELKVVRVEPLTHEAKAIYLEIPNELQEAYKFIPGQYLTFEVEYNGHPQRRAYSICTSPYSEKHLAIGVKKVIGGTVSVYMNEQVKEGDKLRVSQPAGNFIHQPDPTLSNHYVLLGGGSGITPLMAILKSVLEIEPLSRVTLIYANRNQASIMFRQQLEQLQSSYKGQLQVIHSLDEGPGLPGGYSGLLTQKRLTDILQTSLQHQVGEAEYFVCGPSGLMQLIDQTLAGLGVNKNKIYKEYFTAPMHGDDEKSDTTDIPLKEATLIITLDGQQIEVQYQGQKSILEAALDAGYDPPYACQIGACCTCRARLKEGRVVMAEREALSDAEIAEGYILTCQSRPLTSRLVYSYDE